jgi:ribonuclease P protein component
MLARTYRLRKNSDFQRLYKTGKRFTTANLVLYWSPSKLDYTQFGFVISKKVAKKATVRNSLKRRLTAVVEEKFDGIRRPIKAIVLIKNDFGPLSPKELQSEVTTLLQKVIQ